MRPLRFCMLSTFYPPWNFGGDGIQVQRLAHALADRGHGVTVVCSPPAHRLLSRSASRPLPEESPEHPRVEIVPLDGGPISLGGRYLTGRPVGGRRQLERLLARDFDVLHFHNPSLIGAPALLAMGNAIKLYTAHEQWLLCPSHLLWRGDRVCEHPQCLSCEIRHGRPPQLWRRTPLLKRSLRQLDALIVPSRTSARLHERFAELVRVEVLPHFTPGPAAGGEQEARPETVGSEALAPERPYFLYAGRLEPIKGVETLIEAFRGRPEQLVIAGEGKLERRLRRSAADLPNVRFAGWLSASQLDGLYQGALGVVMPTRGHEVLPLVALEAFASGTPLIVRRFGVLAELAETSGAALAYSSSDELQAALDRIASDEELRRALGERGLVAAAERFSLEAHLDGYLSLISELARERGNRRPAHGGSRG